MKKNLISENGLNRTYQSKIDIIRSKSKLIFIFEFSDFKVFDKEFFLIEVNIGT